MPSHEARAAFHKSQSLATQLSDANGREHVISDLLKVATDEKTRESLEGQLLAVRAEWTRLHGEYVQAFAEYTAAVVQSRKG
jgi:hypothetical protein